MTAAALTYPRSPEALIIEIPPVFAVADNSSTFVALATDAAAAITAVAAVQ